MSNLETRLSKLEAANSFSGATAVLVRNRETGLVETRTTLYNSKRSRERFFFCNNFNEVSTAVGNWWSKHGVTNGIVIRVGTRSRERSVAGEESRN